MTSSDFGLKWPGSSAKHSQTSDKRASKKQSDPPYGSAQVMAGGRGGAARGGGSHDSIDFKAIETKETEVCYLLA